MISLKITLAAALGMLTAIAAADPYIVCELGPTAVPSSIASQYSITLKDTTSDGSFALYEATSQSQADTVVAAMATNPSIVSRTIQSSPRMPPGKGSTLPVVGGRQDLVVANDSLLNLINWSPTLAQGAGRQVKVAILDTGLSDNQGNLWAKVVASQNFVEPGLLPIDRAMGTDSSGDGVVDGGTGHGTMVAGIIDLVAPQTSLIIARVADSDGMATTWSVVHAIRYAVEQGAEVINLSLASPDAEPVIARAIAYAESHGVTVVAGLGNSSMDKAFYPAKYSDVIGVAGLQSDGTKASYSNWNAAAKAAAPGLSVISQSETGSLSQWSGTSCATAFVTATIADCLRRRGHVPPNQIRDAISFSGGNLNGVNPHYANQLGVLIDHQALNTALGN